MGMLRSGWNRLTSRPAECLSLTIDWRNDLCLGGVQVVPRYFCSDAPRVFGVGQAPRRRSTGSKRTAFHVGKIAGTVAGGWWLAAQGAARVAARARRLAGISPDLAACRTEV